MDLEEAGTSGGNGTLRATAVPRYDFVSKDKRAAR